MNFVCKRKKLIISCTIISIVFGICMYFFSPKHYKATTSLQITNYKRTSGSDVLYDMEIETRDIVAVLKQQVLSRTTLEYLIKGYGLYEELLKKLPIENVVILMRESISVQTLKGDILEIEFYGKNPKKVALIANAIAAAFVEESICIMNANYGVWEGEEVRSQCSQETAKKRIDQQEKIMQDYKLRYYNKTSQLDSLQYQLQRIKEEQRGLKRTQVMHRKQKELTLNITSLKKKEEDILKQIKTYQKWINDTHMQDTEWASIMHDYKQLNQEFQLLLYHPKYLGRGIQLRIINIAYVPNTHYSPILWKTMILAIAFGCGVIGAILLIDIVQSKAYCRTKM